MAASHSSTVVGVIQLEDSSKRSMDRLSDALDRYSDITEPTGVAAAPDVPEQSKPDPFISDWPIKSHPPVIIATCPHCTSSVEGNPVSWEIVVDPKAPYGPKTVRGQMQHQHDGGVLVRWPFAATEQPSLIDDIVAAEIAGEYDEDIEEGRERNVDEREPWGFTPDPDDEDVEPLSIESAVYQALGGASTCWEDLSDAGVFDSTRAHEIGGLLLEYLDVETRREVSKRAAHIDAERHRLAGVLSRARAALNNVRYMTTDSDVMLAQGMQEVRDALAEGVSQTLRRDSRS